MTEASAERSAGAPVRGTQSFVGVMSAVWRRPSLTALEILWRWIAGGSTLALAVWQLQMRWHDVHRNTSALEVMTVFQPVAAFQTIGVAAHSVAGAVIRPALWVIPVAVGIWLIAGAFGRTFELRWLDNGLHARPFSLLVLGAVRMTLIASAWAVWVRIMFWAAQVAIMGPATQGSEPNLVLYCAIVICGSLLLYVAWAVFSWAFHLAPLLAMERNIGAGEALREAFRSGHVRGKLIEINLVMNIVKIAVLVLAMVLSASPLPFTEVATQTFLTYWWTGVALLYFAAMDYFHVVSSVAYLELWRALQES